MGCPWDNREMFEMYLYDYLMKNGRREIAEIFRREANLPFDPMFPPAIDAPDGFLHEWWLMFHDIFKAWQPKNSDTNEASSYMAEEILNVNQQGGPSQSREQEMNEEMVRELTGSSSDFELTTGDYLMPLVGCRLAESEQTSRGLTSQTQQTSLTESKYHHPVDFTDIIVRQGIASPNCGTLEPKKVEPLERGRKNKPSAGSEYGSNILPVAADCPSETSSPVCKSFDETVKLTNSHDSGDKEEGNTSSSNSQINYADTETLKG